jgi:hypothetical protein
MLSSVEQEQAEANKRTRHQQEKLIFFILNPPPYNCAGMHGTLNFWKKSEKILKKYANWQSAIHARAI